MLHYEEHRENVTCEDILIKLFPSSQLAKILNQSVYSFYILESIAKRFSSRLHQFIFLHPVYASVPGILINIVVCQLLPKTTLYCLYIYFFISCEMNYIWVFKNYYYDVYFVNCFFVVSVQFWVGDVYFFWFLNALYILMIMHYFLIMLNNITWSEFYNFVYNFSWQIKF